VAAIEAVSFPWTNALPPSGEADPVWRIVRTSGLEVFLFDSGDLSPGAAIRSTLGRFAGFRWRGESANATPPPPASLPERQRGRHLPHVLPGMEEKPRQGRTVAERTLDPDHPVRTVFSDPSEESPMPPRVVGELPGVEHPAQRINRRHGE